MSVSNKAGYQHRFLDEQRPYRWVLLLGPSSIQRDGLWLSMYAFRTEYLLVQERSAKCDLLALRRIILGYGERHLTLSPFGVHPRRLNFSMSCYIFLLRLARKRRTRRSAVEKAEGGA